MIQRVRIRLASGLLSRRYLREPLCIANRSCTDQTAAAVLERGGHTVDGAIAANAALGFIELMMNGVGGDLFAIVYQPRTGNIIGINASWAPSATSIGYVKDARRTGNTVPSNSVRRYDSATSRRSLGGIARPLW